MATFHPLSLHGIPLWRNPTGDECDYCLREPCECSARTLDLIAESDIDPEVTARAIAARSMERR